MVFYYRGNLNANFNCPFFTGMMLLAQHGDMNWDVFCFVFFLCPGLPLTSTLEQRLPVMLSYWRIKKAPNWAKINALQVHSGTDCLDNQAEASTKHSVCFHGNACTHAHGASWKRRWRLLALKDFIISAFFPAPAILFPVRIHSWMTSGGLQLCKYVRGTGAIWACSHEALDSAAGGLIPIILFCMWPCWHQSASPLWSDACSCLFF